MAVVLAVREAEETIGRDVRRIAEHLRAAGLTFEILAVNDGCRDNSLAVLRLLEREVPELRVCLADMTGRAFSYGASESQAPVVVLADPHRGAFPLAALGWALARLDRDTDAVVFRGRCVVARRLTCLASILRAVGRGDTFEVAFERQSAHLRVGVVGARSPRRLPGLLMPVLRFLAA